jgi:hypothetical protein
MTSQAEFPARSLIRFTRNTWQRNREMTHRTRVSERVKNHCSAFRVGLQPMKIRVPNMGWSTFFEEYQRSLRSSSAARASASTIPTELGRGGRIGR